MTGEQQVHRLSGDQWTWSAATNPIPSSADVVIVGGGIVGVSTAYFLARKGVSVALFEKGHIAGEQSGRNWGWVRQQGRSPVELPLMIQSLGVWQGSVGGAGRGRRLPAGWLALPRGDSHRARGACGMAAGRTGAWARHPHAEHAGA